MASFSSSSSSSSSSFSVSTPPAFCQRPLTKTWFQRPLTIETENAVGGGGVWVFRCDAILFFYSHPLWEHGSTDGHFHFLFLCLCLFLHTSNFLFLLGTENAVGGHLAILFMSKYNLREGSKKIWKSGLWPHLTDPPSPQHAYVQSPYCDF